MTASVLPTAGLPGGMRAAPRNKYFSLAAMSIQRVIVYRRSLFTNFAANLVWVTVFYFLWQAVFAAQPRIAGFDWDRMRTYLMLAYAGNMLFNGTGGIWRVIMAIRTGNIVLDLTRPYNFRLSILAMTLGNMLLEGALAAALILAGHVLFLHLLPPASPAALAGYLLSVLLGFLTRFMIIYLASLLCFWTLNWMGIHWLHTSITNLLSGAMIPLAMFPDWLRAVAMALPFQAVINTPLMIYLGETTGAGILAALGLQLFWIVVLWLIGSWMWSPCVRALEVQGG